MTKEFRHVRKVDLQGYFPRKGKKMARVSRAWGVEWIPVEKLVLVDRLVDSNKRFLKEPGDLSFDHNTPTVLEEDFQMMVHEDAGPSYRVSIPAGSKVWVVSAGNPSVPIVWGVYN